MLIGIKCQEVLKLAVTQMANFYDRIGKKFGGYAYGSNKPRYTSEYPAGDPEKVFKDEILKLKSNQKIVLDIGCGDGKFAFELSPYFKKIVGIDNSKQLLKVAAHKLKEAKVKNLEFIFANAQKIPFPTSKFDIAINRRGPSFYPEYHRILKIGAYYLEIGIGEKDTKELKEIFGRGQNYQNWDQSRLKKDVSEFKKLGFKIILAKDLYYQEYYPNYHQIDVFLQGVPIFEDYETKKDKILLDKYIKKYQTKNGIVLNRHRVVYKLQK